MVNVNEAIRKAETFAKKVIDKSLTHIAVEEVELSGDEKTRLITLGWDEPMKSVTSSALKSVIGPERIYKVFYVDIESGKVNKMKLR